jgi:signal transduction histidine kinase
VYRVVQEAVNNILKHAHASSASIDVKRLSQSIEIEVRDNGRGFPDRPGDRTGFGLSGIERRVRLLDGTFSLKSSIGNGTALRITLPLGK